MKLQLQLFFYSTFLFCASCVAPPLLEDGILEGDQANLAYQDWRVAFEPAMSFPHEFHLKSTWDTVGFFPDEPDVRILMGTDMDFVLHDSNDLDSFTEFWVDAMGISIKTDVTFSNDEDGFHLHFHDPAFLRLAFEMEVPSFVHISEDRLARVFEVLQAGIDALAADPETEEIDGLADWYLRAKKITGLGAALHPQELISLFGSLPLLTVSRLEVRDGMVLVTYDLSQQYMDLLEAEDIKPEGREIIESLKLEAGFGLSTGTIQNFLLESKIFGPTDEGLKPFSLLLEFTELQRPIVPAPLPDPSEVVSLDPYFDALFRFMDGG